MIHHQPVETITGLNGGRYYVVDPSKSKSYPSVTTILGNMTDKSGIEAWKKRVGEKKAAQISKYSANRGSFMHLLNENYLDLRYTQRQQENLLKDTFDKTLEDPDVKDFDRSELICGKDLFMNFYNARTFETLKDVVIQEIALWSPRGGGYAGRVDLVATMKDSTLKIIDFKSSTKPKSEKWIDNYKMQIAAYAVAYYDLHGQLPDGGEIWISNEEYEYPQIFKMDRNDIKHWFIKFQELVKGYHEKFHK